jgi:hypothetical protein
MSLELNSGFDSQVNPRQVSVHYFEHKLAEPLGISPPRGDLKSVCTAMSFEELSDNECDCVLVHFAMAAPRSGQRHLACIPLHGP